MDTPGPGMYLALLLLLAFSAFFSASETAAFVGQPHPHEEHGAKWQQKAQLALDLSENYDKLLSTILIGNNIVNIGAASIGTVLFTRYYGDGGVTLSTVVMTVLVLIFGEISPKSVAKESPERFAMFSAPILRVCLMVLAPVNWRFYAVEKAAVPRIQKP